MLLKPMQCSMGRLQSSRASPTHQDTWAGQAHLSAGMFQALICWKGASSITFLAHMAPMLGFFVVGVEASFCGHHADARRPDQCLDHNRVMVCRHLHEMVQNVHEYCVRIRIGASSDTRRAVEALRSRGCSGRYVCGMLVNNKFLKRFQDSTVSWSDCRPLCCSGHVACVNFVASSQPPPQLYTIACYPINLISSHPTPFPAPVLLRSALRKVIALECRCKAFLPERHQKWTIPGS